MNYLMTLDMRNGKILEVNGCGSIFPGVVDAYSNTRVYGKLVEGLNEVRYNNGPIYFDSKVDCKLSEDELAVRREIDSSVLQVVKSCGEDVVKKFFFQRSRKEDKRRHNEFLYKELQEAGIPYYVCVKFTGEGEGQRLHYLEDDVINDVFVANDDIGLAITSKGPTKRFPDFFINGPADRVINHYCLERILQNKVFFHLFLRETSLCESLPYFPRTVFIGSSFGNAKVLEDFFDSVQSSDSFVAVKKIPFAARGKGLEILCSNDFIPLINKFDINEENIHRILDGLSFEAALSVVEYIFRYHSAIIQEFVAQKPVMFNDGKEYEYTTRAIIFSGKYIGGYKRLGDKPIDAGCNIVDRFVDKVGRHLPLSEEEERETSKIAEEFSSVFISKFSEYFPSMKKLDNFILKSWLNSLYIK